MISLFRREKSGNWSDKLWMEHDFAVKGIATEALMALRREEMPVVISFFPETHKRTMERFAALGVPVLELRSGTLEHVANPGKVVAMAETGIFPPAFLVDFLTRRAAAGPVVLLFSEHYPLLEQERSVIEKLKTASKAGSVMFFLSLEDPLFRSFGGDRLRELTEKLMTGPEECIEHSLVSAAIQNARKKISDSVTTVREALSAEEWFQKNFKVAG